MNSQYSCLENGKVHFMKLALVFHLESHMLNQARNGQEMDGLKDLPHLQEQPHPQSGQGFGVGPRLGHGSPLKKGTQLQTYNI